jgi:hypothetical protein
MEKQKNYFHDWIFVKTVPVNDFVGCVPTICMRKLTLQPLVAPASIGVWQSMLGFPAHRLL